MTTRRRPGPTDPAVDADRLRDLARDLSDVELVRTLVRTFLAELPDRLAQVRVGGEGGTRAAHSLSSGAALLGAAHLAAVSADLEHGTGDREEVLLAAGDAAEALRRWLAVELAGGPVAEPE